MAHKNTNIVFSIIRHVMKQLSFLHEQLSFGLRFGTLRNNYCFVYDPTRYQSVSVCFTIWGIRKQISFCLHNGTFGNNYRLVYATARSNSYRFVYYTAHYHTGIFLSTIRHVFKQLSFGIQFGNVEKK